MKERNVKGDSVFAANLEVRLKEAYFPIGQDHCSRGLSLVKLRGDSVWANGQGQFSIGRNCKLSAKCGTTKSAVGYLSKQALRTAPNHAHGGYSNRLEYLAWG
ncbi:Translocase of chloroplast 159/132, membrane anchor domain containing protein [Trema orientale]|uniref:Translocase of chloroplast 159/132, membrane anchor domain containing protein n=1 Tax=Trema orientale TaxID=63057 RepID=A0A2P5AGU5_TREOI|nr:Translocase of chloroplast 159/132, membrane anchor domain containing protein [Trema orientale]